MSRRGFIGMGAATVLSLPSRAVGRHGGDDTTRDSDERPQLPPEGQPEGYPRETEHGGFFGSMDVPEFDDDMSVTVDVYPNQPEMNIGLTVSFGGIEVGPAIDPDEARALGETLLEAAEDVEAWQEANISEAQREAYW